MPSLFCVSYRVHSCSSFAQFRPIWSLCMQIMSGIWIKNREVTCYLWHDEYIFGIGYVFIWSFTCTYYFFTFWSIVSSKFCCQRKCKWSWESNTNVSAAIVTFSIVSPLLYNPQAWYFQVEINISIVFLPILAPLCSPYSKSLHLQH